MNNPSNPEEPTDTQYFAEYTRMVVTHLIRMVTDERNRDQYLNVLCILADWIESECDRVREISS